VPVSRNTDIGVAIIGCGRVSGHHCRSIRRTPGVRLSAVCDLVDQKAAAYAEEFGVPHFTSYHEMLRTVPDVDAVAIVTPSGMHYEHALEIIETYRKHVVVEKPTFLKPSHMLEVYGAAARLGVQVFPVFQNRYNRAVCRVKEALGNGQLGDVRVVAVRVRWCRPQRYYDMSPWRGTFAQDGGALTNQGIHHVDLLRWLGGEVTAVGATMGTLGVDVEVEDTVAAALRYRSGAIGTLEVTTAARPQDFEASISLVCSKGLAQIGGIAVNELQLFTPDADACGAWSEDFSGDVYGNGHAELYRRIVAFFESGAEYPITRDDALGTLRLLHAFYRSDEEGGWITLDAGGESARLGRPDEALARLYRTPAYAAS
jgi:UDP-N-acetyl-2-amino-2-deoxyglucuronate dehydrogenase